MARFWIIRVVSLTLVIGLAYVAGHYVDTQMLYGGAASWRRIIYLCALYSILSVSLNIINGITGQFSIGHAAFYQIGAYGAAYLSLTLTGAGMSNDALVLAVVTLFGMLLAMAAGWVVGMPSLRLRGDYLAIATLGFGEIVRIVVLNQSWLGGSYGMNTVSLLDRKLMVPILLVLALTIAVSRNLLRTPHGLAFLSIREDEVAANAMGVNTTRYKVLAFMIGAALAGAAGAMLAHYEFFISPDTFKMDVSFIVLTMVVVGGTGSITGSLLAAVALVLLLERLANLQPIPAGPLYMIGLFLTVGSLWATAHCRRKEPSRVESIGVWSGVVLVSAVGGVALGRALANVPALASTFGREYPAYSLRLVLFALALVVIMLVRPQGIFGHREFSWAAAGRILGFRGKEPALP